MALAVTPRGEVAVGGSDGAVAWLEATDGLQSAPAVRLHSDSIRSMVVAAADGLVLLSGGDDQVVRVSEGRVDQRTSAVSQFSDGAVWSLAVTSDGDRVFSGSGAGTLRKWDRLTGAVDAVAVGGGAVLSMVMIDDGFRIVTGSRDGLIRMWHGPGLELVGDPLQGHRKAVLALATTGDERFVVSGGEDGLAALWDVLRPASASLPPLPVGPPINAIVGIPDSTTVVLGTADGEIHLWDYDARRIRAAFGGHDGAVLALAVVPDGSLLLSGGEDGTVRAWVTDRAGTTIDVGEAAPRRGRRHAGVQSDVESVKDELGFVPDVDAVAALLSAKETPPQLSVALLGDWGSGKSSFMAQTIVRVDALADGAKQDPTASDYVAHVGQVRFNVWHYSDDHLWVGLVEHLIKEITFRQQEQADQARRASLRTELDRERDKLREGAAALAAVQSAAEETGWLGRLNQPARVAAVLRGTQRSLWRELRTPRRLIVTLVALAASIAVALAALRFGQPVIAWIAGVATVVGGLVGPAVAVQRRVQRISDDLIDELQRQQQLRTARVGEVKGQLARADPQFRLEQLLSEIGTPDRYEQYRGLIGKIHRDLQRLNDDLTAAKLDWEDGRSASPPALQRIILYVDDLDRCPPEQIIHVLQTVNLLLTLPLFVVVVAADPRWLLSALDRHHRQQFGDDEGPRSLHYLDKIFQIPYTMRPVRAHAAEYLRGLLPTAEPSPADEAPPTSQDTTAPEAVTTEPAEGASVELAPTQPEPQAPQPAVAPQEHPAIVLHLRHEERDFLPLLVPILTTPRAIKKLTNLYRLLRAGIPDLEADRYIGGPQGGPYQAAALLLAGIVSAPSEANRLLTALVHLPPSDPRDITEVLRSIPDELPVANLLAGLVESIRGVQPVHGDIGTYRTWAGVVARYSFDAYRLFDSLDTYTLRLGTGRAVDETV